MSRERKTSYRSQFDGHRRLAAAVILQAVKDFCGSASDLEKEAAVEFLEGDMWPFSDVLDLPTDGTALRDYIRQLRKIAPEPSG